MKSLKEMTIKDYFNIPNLLSYFRLAMLPVFLTLYIHADDTRSYVIAFVVLAVAMSTDLFDGMIARKYHMVTEWGKMMDPIADKLTQGVLAIAVCTNYPHMIYFIIIFVIKEVYMGLMGLYLLKKGKGVLAALYFGKVVTVVIDVLVAALLLLPNLDTRIADILIALLCGAVLYCGIRYLIIHIKMLKEN